VATFWDSVVVEIPLYFQILLEQHIEYDLSLLFLQIVYFLLQLSSFISLDSSAILTASF